MTTEITRASGRRASGVFIAVVAVIAAACSTGTASSAPTGATTGSTTPATPGASVASSAGSGKVTVGFISPTTGFVAALGTDMKRGWDLYWELHGNTAGGATVETVYEDDAGDPEMALTKARRLVEEVKVDLTAGPILANRSNSSSSAF